MIAGAWFTWVVCIDFTKHSRSAMAAVRGRKLETVAPLSPWRAKSGSSPSMAREVCPSSMVLKRLPPATESGIGSPWRWRRIGFQSNRSTWDGAPFWNR